jgi:predicted GNAT family acetyltransferase
MKHEVIENAAESQFELKVDDATAIIGYSRAGDLISLDHTEVPDALAGRGIGSALAKGALDLLQGRNQKIQVRCSFITNYIDKHPEYRSLVA